jgi:hypothetical protein
MEHHAFLNLFLLPLCGQLAVCFVAIAAGRALINWAASASLNGCRGRETGPPAECGDRGRPLRQGHGRVLPSRQEPYPVDRAMRLEVIVSASERPNSTDHLLVAALRLGTGCWTTTQDTPEDIR